MIDHRIPFTAVISVVLLGCISIYAQDTPPSDKAVAPVSRTIRLDYAVKLLKLPIDAKVRVWLPVPSSDDYQQVREIDRELPALGQIHHEPVFGNKILHFETTGPESGESTFRVSYRVRRLEVQALAGPAGDDPLSDNDRRRFLAANRKVPITGKPLLLLDGLQFREDSVSVARRLYDRVDEHVRYDKSKPGYGNGDVLWVCDSRFGNCTDFHSLFISLARSQGIPARFEIGFPLPVERGKGTIGGYHCWAYFHAVDHGWVPVDISEADKHPELKEYYFGNLSENRIAFSAGRDINLVPRQKSEPLNYFIYPHVEVDGKEWPKERIQLSCSYTDD